METGINVVYGGSGHNDIRLKDANRDLGVKVQDLSILRRLCLEKCPPDELQSVYLSKKNGGHGFLIGAYIRNYSKLAKRPKVQP